MTQFWFLMGRHFGIERHNLQIDQLDRGPDVIETHSGPDQLAYGGAMRNTANVDAIASAFAVLRYSRPKTVAAVRTAQPVLRIPLALETMS
jgi:hypothetical protein